MSEIERLRALANSHDFGPIARVLAAELLGPLAAVAEAGYRLRGAGPRAWDERVDEHDRALRALTVALRKQAALR